LPFRIEEFALRQDSAGAGTFRGGLGFRKTYRMLAACNLGTNLDRTLCPPWGVQGGSAAQSGRFTIRRAGAEQPASIDKENALPLAAGDVVCVETGGGGGYGPPSGRQLQLIERDVAAGYVSAAAAERDYGVKIGRDGKAHR
jgi:N-methylhydantoinase B